MSTEKRTARQILVVIALLLPLIASFLLAVSVSVFLFRYGVREDRVAIIAYLIGSITYFYYPRLAEQADIEAKALAWVTKE